jgi:uncharacterized protein (TIGR00661 family)
LDWGLGHATRCIPIIRELLSRNCDVFVAGSGDSLKLLNLEFPFLPSFVLPSYNPVYPSNGSMIWAMLLQVPKFSSVIRKEHRCIEELIERHGINILISDNRYGCWSKEIPAVFTTHQTNIQMPKKLKWLEGVVHTITMKLMSRFSVCWIPDIPGEKSMAGDMASSASLSIPVKHIGLLSRFTADQPKRNDTYDISCILSGPEPQRTVLEKIVQEQLVGSGLRYIIVRGVLSQDDGSNKQVERVAFMNSEKLQAVIEQSTCVIARSGYSTIMDLARLGKKVIFIPTPGQTEQEYLADRMMKMRIAYYMKQNAFDLKIALEESKTFSGFPLMNTGELLTKAIDDILSDSVMSES